MEKALKMTPKTAFLIVGLLMLGALIVIVFLPGHIIKAAGNTRLVFNTADANKASILAIAKQNEKKYEPSKKTINIIVTSYNSEPNQTDSTPFITAFGTQVRDGIVATNYLPKGTRVRFPDLYGNKIFVVEDRMNIRYQRHMDIWSADKQFSKNFGARWLRMEIL